MQYTVRAFIDGHDVRLDWACKMFCSMERTAYNLLRDGTSAGGIKATLREMYGVWNSRWIESAVNQAKAATKSETGGIRYRIELFKQKARNLKQKEKGLSNPLKIQRCEAKIVRYRTRSHQLEKQLAVKSYPRAVFGSRKLLRQLFIAAGRRKDELREEWRERRSNHLFSVGQANQKGNGNTRLSAYENGSKFLLEVRNWPGGDFDFFLRVPEHWSGIINDALMRAESVKLGSRGEILEGGLPYSVRLLRSKNGYQVMVSFELDVPLVKWSGRLAGVDINPEGIACTIVSGDGNLVATRYFEDNRLITASRNKRKWVLEDMVNKMLRWAKYTHGCNAVVIEELKFGGAYDFSPRTNFKLSNFMKGKMLRTIRLHALKMSMLSVEVNPAYTSLVAVAKSGNRFGGFNRHQLAAFVIGRRAQGFGEAPSLHCLPTTRKDKAMWNHCIRYYGHQPRIQTLPPHEPMEWKSGGDVNGGGMMTELLIAPPATTSAMGLSHSPQGVFAIKTASRRAGRVRPNPHAKEGEGVGGHRVSPPGVARHQSAVIFDDNEDSKVTNSLSSSPETQVDDAV